MHFGARLVRASPFSLARIARVPLPALMQITIDADEQSGRITVTTDDGAEPYECQSPAECLDYLSDLLGAEPASADETGEAVEPDAAAMWDEEASRRPPTGLMA